MGWREDAKLGIGRIGRLFLGETNGQLGTEVTATAAEINQLDGVLDGYIVSGTAQISLIEADVLDGATAGTQVAAKAVVADANVNIGVVKATALHVGATGAEVEITSTPAELNILDTAVVTAAELNLLDNMWASFTATIVDVTDGTGTIQIVFKDAAGATMATPVAGRAYISEVATGLTMDILDDGLAVLTNGVIRLTTATIFDSFEFISTAAGLLGLTLAGNADSYWVCIVHPTGKLVISDEIAITG